MAKEHFAILLFTDSKEQAISIEKLVKPVFPKFFVARSEEEALTVINKEKITILFMGLSSIQANESSFLHLISSKEVDVASIIKRKFLLCGKDEIRDAFSVCNKEIFDDYFITRPLYDPYHILIRLRFLMRLFRDEQKKQSTIAPISADEMLSYFDKVIGCEQAVTESNEQQGRQLVAAVSVVLDTLKSGVNKEHMAKKLHANLLALIEDGAERELQNEVAEQQKKNYEVNSQLQNVADIARVKKAQLNNAEPLDLDAADCLIIENDVTASAEIDESLTKHGGTTFVARNAASAVKLLTRLNPKIVLVDMTLPDMSTLYVVGKIKELSPDTKILLMARAVDRTNAEACLHAGADSVVIKPLNQQVLLHKVHKCLVDA